VQGEVWSESENDKGKGDGQFHATPPWQWKPQTPSHLYKLRKMVPATCVNSQPPPYGELRATRPWQWKPQTPSHLVQPPPSGGCLLSHVDCWL
jgi:hypothetical protein